MKEQRQTKPRKVLIVHEGRLIGPSGQSVNVSATPVVIGRDPGCALVLADPEVSAVHCEVVADSEGVLLRDLGSKNGTIVGSMRVREAFLTGPATLKLGSSTVTFEPTTKAHVSIAKGDSFGGLVGDSVRMRQLFDTLRLVAPTNLTVLITGETGTGKELVARAIHDHSPRKDGPFVVVDCTTIVPNLAESHLFGQVRGAFTDAVDTPGAFEQADGGTVFLDELGDLPQSLQSKLLRVLAEHRVQRVGATKSRDIDVRVIAATHKDLLLEINKGQFRADLFHRLAQVRLSLSPLRDRREDIPRIVYDLCLDNECPERAVGVLQILDEVLSGYAWPGNVRELVLLVEAILALPPGAVSVDGTQPDSIPLTSLLPMAAGRELAGPTAPFSKAKREACADFEKRYFRELMEATSNNVSEMARRSGLERHHVRAYLKKYGLRGTGE